MNFDILLPATKLINGKEDLIRELRQLLFNYNLFSSNKHLDQFLEEYIKNGGDTAPLLKITNNTHTFASVVFYLGLLCHERNTYSKKIFDSILEAYETVKKEENIELGWDGSEIIVYVNEAT